jgi:urease accessory protein UreH
VLVDGYAEPPLRIGGCFNIEQYGGAAYLILACTGPGVFAGDRLEQRVTVGRGARVVLASQSARQIHPAAASAPAVVHHEYHVADDGELQCHWDPIVPFARARLVERCDLRVAATGRVYWSEALMSGRATRGESWAFESIDRELRFTVAGSLRYLERYRLAGPDRPCDRQWIAGANSYVGAVIVHHEAVNDVIAGRVQDDLNGVESVRAGVDRLDERLLIARLLADRGPAFARARARVRAVVLATAFQSPAELFRR